MENIQIKQFGKRFTVVADTERFGRHAILFEGISFEECANWIKANTERLDTPLFAVKISFSKDSEDEFRWVCVRSRSVYSAPSEAWHKGYCGERIYYHGAVQIA